MSKDVFYQLFNAFSSAYSKLQEIALTPDNKKTLKKWGITDAAEMIGRTPQTLRNIEENDQVPKPEIIRKGKREERLYSLTLINQLRDFFGTRVFKPKQLDPAIMCFVNFKGGAGKSTSAVNAAQDFALKGYRVLIVDCDSQGSSTAMFGFDPNIDFSESNTLLDILTLKSDNIKEKIIKTYWDGLDLIPANLGLYNAELQLPMLIAEQKAKTFYNHLNNALKSVYQDYDMIIFDCPPSMGMISINAIYAANMIVVGMPPDIIDFSSTKQFFKMVAEVLDRLPQKYYDAVKLLITRHNKRKNAIQIYDILKGKIGETLLSNYMIESEAVKTAAADMKTLYEVNKYVGNKKTYERAMQSAQLVNDELESQIKLIWEQKELKQYQSKEAVA